MKQRFINLSEEGSNQIDTDFAVDPDQCLALSDIRICEQTSAGLKEYHTLQYPRNRVKQPDDEILISFNE